MINLIPIPQDICHYRCCFPINVYIYIYFMYPYIIYISIYIYKLHRLTPMLYIYISIFPFSRYFTHILIHQSYTYIYIYGMYIIYLYQIPSSNIYRYPYPIYVVYNIHLSPSIPRGSPLRWSTHTHLSATRRRCPSASITPAPGLGRCAASRRRGENGSAVGSPMGDEADDVDAW